MKRELSLLTTRERLLVAAVSACFAAGPAWANPTGPQVVNGAATFNQAGKLLTVTNSNGAIINWNSFSIGAGEATRFNQASASSSVLNRVLANDPSVLLGTLSSNGRVWLVNPAGILVGQGARIDVGGFIASTLAVKNEDFLAGRLSFQATPNAGKLENSGTISTPFGGSVYLVAPTVSNSGLINAPNGEVILAAGQAVQLLDTGTPGVKAQITGSAETATNLGQILAEAGRIGLAAAFVRNSGELNASSVVREGGRIFLRASQDAYVDGAGRIVTTGTKGGAIEVLGSRVAVMDDAQLDASGQSGGGSVLVGGDYQGKNPAVQNSQITYFGPAASIKADATETGDGGKVVVWADDTTRAYGNISVRGGAGGGNGGFVETSGRKFLDATRAPDLSAPAGRPGEWLLDPDSIIISSMYGSSYITGSSPFQPSGGYGTSYLQDTVLRNALGYGGTVTVDTTSSGTGTGNITVYGSTDTYPANLAAISVGPGTGGGGGTLNLLASNDITINSSITSAGYPLAMNFVADQTHTGGGTTGYGGVITIGPNVSLMANNASISMSAARGISIGSGSTISTGTGGGWADLTFAANAANTSAGYFSMSPTSTLISAKNVSITAGDAYLDGTIQRVQSNPAVGTSTLAVNAAGSATVHYGAKILGAPGGSAYGLNVNIAAGGGTLAMYGGIATYGGDALLKGSMGVALGDGTNFAYVNATTSNIGSGADSAPGGRIVVDAGTGVLTMNAQSHLETSSQAHLLDANGNSTGFPAIGIKAGDVNIAAGASIKLNYTSGTAYGGGDLGFIPTSTGAIGLGNYGGGSFTLDNGELSRLFLPAAGASNCGTAEQGCRIWIGNLGTAPDPLMGTLPLTYQPIIADQANFTLNGTTAMPKRVQLSTNGSINDAGTGAVGGYYGAQAGHLGISGGAGIGTSDADGFSFIANSAGFTSSAGPVLATSLGTGELALRRVMAAGDAIMKVNGAVTVLPYFSGQIEAVAGSFTLSASGNITLANAGQSYTLASSAYGSSATFTETPPSTASITAGNLNLTSQSGNIGMVGIQTVSGVANLTANGAGGISFADASLFAGGSINMSAPNGTLGFVGSAGGSFVVSGGPMTLSASNISLTGGNVGVIVLSGGAQTVSATNSIVLQAGNANSAFSPSFYGSSAYGSGIAGVSISSIFGAIGGGSVALGSASTQSVSAQFIDVYAGATGHDNAAVIQSYGGQTISITGSAGMLDIRGGGDNSSAVYGGLGSYNNFAAISHGTWTSPTTTAGTGDQTVSVAGGGRIRIAAGAGTGVSGYYGSDCVAAGFSVAACSGSNNYGVLENSIGAQTINMSSTGAIAITGGAAGSKNYASIGSRGAGLQTIGGSPGIGVYGGAGGGAYVGSYGGKDFTLSNDADIHSDSGASTINAGSVDIQGGSAAYGGAGISSNALTLNATGNVNLVGGSTTPVTALLAAPAYIGQENAGSITLNIGGSLNATGNNSGVLIGTRFGATNTAINANGSIAFAPGTTPGSVAIGSFPGLGGSLALSAASGSISLADAKIGTGSTGTATTSLTAAGSITQSGTGRTNTDQQTMSSSAGSINMPGENRATNVTANGYGGVIYYSDAPTTHISASAANGNILVQYDPLGSGSSSLALGTLNAPTGSVTVTARGAILDDNATGTVNVTASSANFTSVYGGASGGLAVSSDTAVTGALGASVSSGASYGGIRIANYGGAPSSLTLTDNAASGAKISFFNSADITNSTGYALKTAYGGDLNLQSGGNLTYTGGSLATPSGNATVGAAGNLSVTGAMSTPANVNLLLSAGTALSVSGSVSTSGTGSMTLASPSASISGTLSGGTDVNANTATLNLGSGASVNAGRDVIVNGGSVSAANGKVSAGRDANFTLAADLRLNDGSSVTGGNDIWLTLNGVTSTLYLNEVSGRPASYLWAKAPSTIHLSYTSRTSGGLVVDGAPIEVADLKTASGGSGFFFSSAMTPAVSGGGLMVTGVPSTPAAAKEVVAVVSDTTNTTVISTIIATTTTTTTAATTTAATPVPPPPVPLTSSTGMGMLKTDQTTGGGEGTFGGAPKETSAGGGEKAKTGEAKKDEKKEDKDKKEEASGKKEDKPVGKKVATCS